jgi:hypothetical protein
MNPARSLAPALVAGISTVYGFILWHPVLGAALGVIGCRCVRERGCCAVLIQLTFLQYDDLRLHQQATRSCCEAIGVTNSDGATIHGGYHLTELKAASFDTVDCGRAKNQWNETIVQLWVS